MPNSTLRFALLGYPVEHSLSPALFSYFAQQAHRPISYRLLSREIPKEAGEATLRSTLQWAFETLHLDALNITSPYKLRVGALCIPSPEHPARLATGAVNLVWQHSGVLYGTNTDIVGVEYLIERANVRAYQLPVLVLGAGGAAEPVLQALCNQKIERICCNRTNERALKLADEYSASFLAYEDRFFFGTSTQRPSAACSTRNNTSSCRCSLCYFAIARIGTLARHSVRFRVWVAICTGSSQLPHHFRGCNNTPSLLRLGARLRTRHWCK